MQIIKNSVFFLIIVILLATSWHYANGQDKNDTNDKQNWNLASPTTQNIILAISIIISTAAIIVTVYTYKKTVMAETYEDLDTRYKEILEMAMADQDLRDSKKTKNYRDAFDKIGKLGKYNIYAYIVWNFCETISDRTKDDLDSKATWYPSIKAEKELHGDWFKEKENQSKFKDKFLVYG